MFRRTNKNKSKNKAKSTKGVRVIYFTPVKANQYPLRNKNLFIINDNNRSKYLFNTFFKLTFLLSIPQLQDMSEKSNSLILHKIGKFFINIAYGYELYKNH